MNLYTLTNDFIHIVNQLEEYDLDPETFNNTLDSLKAPIESKAENIIKYMRSLEAEATALKEEAKRLTERAASKARKAEYFTKYLDENLKAAGIKDLKAGIFDLKYKKGSEIVEVDTEQLPAQYWIPQKPAPMGKPDLKKRLKDGEIIPGVSLVRKPDCLVVK